MSRTKTFDEQEVLNKALHIFWRDGYEATSMDSLVKGLGISRSSLYDTFGDKRQLFFKALGAYRRQSSEVAIRLLADHPDPKSAIRDMMMQAMEEAASDYECKGCFMTNTAVELAGSDEEIARHAKENKDRMVQAFTDAIRRGQRDGTIAKKFPATQLAEFIYTAYNGLQVVGKFDKDLRKLKQSVRLTLSLLDD